MTQNGVAMLEDLRRQHCRSDESYLTDWFDRLTLELRRNSEGWMDLAVAASGITVTVMEHREALMDPLVHKAILTTNPNFDFSAPPDGAVLEGVLNSSKGKYFEYLVTEKLNAGERLGNVFLPSGYHAELATSMTQPGWDVQIVDNHGHVAEYLQMKATESASYIQTALERYPDVQILATSEGAYHFSGPEVLDAGITDHHLTDHVSSALESGDIGFFEAFNPLISLILIAGTEGYKVEAGEVSTQAALANAKHRVQRMLFAKGVGASAAIAGAGWMVAPITIIAGLVFEQIRHENQFSDSLRGKTEEILMLLTYQQDERIRRIARDRRH